MVDVVTFGELLIDLISTESGVSLIEAPAFVKAAGGAPANVAVGLARLGVSSGFMGQVGATTLATFWPRRWRRTAWIHRRSSFPTRRAPLWPSCR